MSAQITIDPETLKPIIATIIVEVLAAQEANRAALGDDRLAYSEAEAARMLGLNQHVLRDERLRGRIQASQIMGRRVRYTRDDLMNYLQGRRKAE